LLEGKKTFIPGVFDTLPTMLHCANVICRYSKSEALPQMVMFTNYCDFYTRSPQTKPRAVARCPPPTHTHKRI